MAITKVNVTEEDWAISEERLAAGLDRNFNCPVALALKRDLRIGDVSVGTETLMIAGEVYQVEKQLQFLIGTMDGGGHDLTPFALVVDHSLRLVSVE